MIYNNSTHRICICIEYFFYFFESIYLIILKEHFQCLQAPTVFLHACTQLKHRKRWCEWSESPAARLPSAGATPPEPRAAAHWRNGYPNNRLGVTTLDCRFTSALFFSETVPSRQERRSTMGTTSWRTVNQMSFSTSLGWCSGAGRADLKNIAVLVVLLLLTLASGSQHGWGWLWMGCREHRRLPGKSRVGNSCHGLYGKQMHR